MLRLSLLFIAFEEKEDVACNVSTKMHFCTVLHSFLSKKLQKLHDISRFLPVFLNSPFFKKGWQTFRFDGVFSSKNFRTLRVRLVGKVVAILYYNHFTTSWLKNLHYLHSIYLFSAKNFTIFHGFCLFFYFSMNLLNH
jgi:hypothetical protein